MITLAATRRRRRPNLTPMIDVVFLLLVFFMLASRFGADRVLALAPAGTAAPGTEVWSGPPRLVDFGPGGLALNGTPVPEGGLAAALAPLMQSDSDPVLLRARAGADLQALVVLMQQLRAAGMTRLILLPGPVTEGG